MGKRATIGVALVCLVGLCGVMSLRSSEPEIAPTLGLAPTEPAPPELVAATAAEALPAPGPAPAGETLSAPAVGPRTLVRLAVGAEAREFFDPQWEAAVEQALPHVDVMVAVAGNRDVLDQLRQQRIDLAAVHGELSWRERDAGLVEHSLGRESFVLVVGETHHPWQLGIEQLRAALTGSATNWLELGGAAQRLRIVIPTEERFLARAASAMVPGDPLAEVCERVIDEAAVLETVRREPGCLGIVRAPALVGATGVRAVRVEGLDLSTERMRAGSCRFGERVLLVSGTDTSAAGREVEAYLTSPAGKALLARALQAD